MTELHRLYAITHSLYSGRARSYLIKHGIPFRELSSGHESFKAEVLPKGKLPTIPTLVTPDGEVIRDGAAIIEHFEAANGRPCQPPGPRQQIVSALFDVIGSDGLLRPAMHYRWNFPQCNHEFVRYHFLHSQRDVPQREDKTEAMMDRMLHAAMFFGVTDQTRDLVERLYLEYLDALDAHFEQNPYLLGWRPCIGDFGLLAPMYAHLGRDPYPARLMQQRATRVYRWVERMNRADQDAPEYFNAGTDFLADDEVPETLLAVLRLLAEDFVPETRAAADAINRWLAGNQPEVGAPAVGRSAHAIGTAEFTVRGETITALAQPYRFYLLQRVQSVYAGLDSAGRAAVDEMLEACGMSAITGIVLDRRISRSGNLEIWA
ncbi:glutathione S-transferase [Kineobactrum sediminis]|uniref:Glutathione S-transferase n=1 Tax=Kineobactrum sediminis TaxID=1905677 RepID=A0A2N5Y238_9GAMM|nr:glutathione S-transferase family protein [Kineobactrum sediminis]PLW82451.1 glutathione S-transferase [Kineobactrum sediminis]